MRARYEKEGFIQTTCVSVREVQTMFIRCAEALNSDRPCQRQAGAGGYSVLASYPRLAPAGYRNFRQLLNFVEAFRIAGSAPAPTGHFDREAEAAGPAIRLHEGASYFAPQDRPGDSVPTV